MSSAKLTESESPSFENSFAKEDKLEVATVADAGTGSRAEMAEVA
jgi:hypothetical protein